MDQFRPLTMCCSLTGPRTNKPLFAIRKSFKVENAGELPLTVMSMNINGYKCQGFGFEVLQCRPFSLDHNSSTEITIAYEPSHSFLHAVTHRLCPAICSPSPALCAVVLRFTPDFTSSWVIRDLTLVTSRGTSFPYTLNVTLPHHMLPLCAQVVPGPSWEETFWVVTLIFTWWVPGPPAGSCRHDDRCHSSCSVCPCVAASRCSACV